MLLHPLELTKLLIANLRCCCFLYSAQPGQYFCQNHGRLWVLPPVENDIITYTCVKVDLPMADAPDDLDNPRATDAPVGEDSINIPRRSQQQRVLTLKDDYIYSKRNSFIRAYNNLLRMRDGLLERLEEMQKADPICKGTESGISLLKATSASFNNWLGDIGAKINSIANDTKGLGSGYLHLLQSQQWGKFYP